MEGLWICDARDCQNLFRNGSVILKIEKVGLERDSSRDVRRRLLRKCRGAIGGES